MPGEEITDLTFREARQQGVLREWQQARRMPNPEPVVDSTTSHTQQVTGGEVLVAKQVHRSGEFSGIIVKAYGDVPDEYGLEVVLEKGASSYTQRGPLESGQNEISSLTGEPGLQHGDVILVRSKWNGDETSTPTIGPVVATISTSHA